MATADTMMLVAPDLAKTNLLRGRFKKLVSEWKGQCSLSSSTEKLAMHPAYQQIVGMGPDGLPLLFAELQESPDHWFWALRAITGQSPVRPEHRGNIPLMAEDWLRWAEENELANRGEATEH